MNVRVACLGVVLAVTVAATVGITTARDGDRFDPLAAIAAEDAPEASRASGPDGARATGASDGTSSPAPAAPCPSGPGSPGLAVPMRRRAPVARFPRASVAELLRAKGWTSFLRAWHGLPPATNSTDRSARFGAATGEWLVNADPVVRQHLIFGVALLAPWAEASARLRELWKTSSDRADAEDALCALAFSGDPEARSAFLALAKTPSAAVVHRLVDTWQDLDAIAIAGGSSARETLRAWRSIEALDREPYFKTVAFEVTHDWSGEGSRELLGFGPGCPLAPSERQALLEGWMARWPGHPGGDGMALRVARLRIDAGDAPGAARWFARALTGTDQDRAGRAEAPLVALVECVLPLDTVEAFARAEIGDASARTLFEYAWLRRTAAEVGFDRACDAVAEVAAREPDGVVARAWRDRLTARPPAGLSSGVQDLSESDPLRRVDERGGEAGTASRSAVPLGRCVRPWVYEPAERLDPDRDPTRLDPDRLRSQLRAWETLADLERRASRTGGILRADTLYKEAAIFYHDRGVLHPAYAWHTFDFGSSVSSLDDAPVEAGSRAPASASFARTSFAWARAAELFDRIEREHPDYPAMDKVVFSAAMCWKRLADYRPSRGVEWLGRARSTESGFGTTTSALCARRAVALFDRVAREFPRSPLADDSARAAAWWRRVHEDWLDESADAEGR